jgi:PilZ domain
MTRQRSIQRVRLRQPIAAHAAGEDVRIVDASIRGVRVAHRNLLYDRHRCSIVFDWNGREIEFVGKVRWTKLQRGHERPLYQSGLEIAEIDQRSSVALRNMIESCVTRALDEQKANARGTAPLRPETLTVRRTPLYTRHELIAGVWRKTMTGDPKQPEAGFTVPVDERPDQIELLRSAYAAAEPSMRTVIRRFAELSILDPDQTWPGRFTP